MYKSKLKAKRMRHVIVHSRFYVKCLQNCTFGNTVWVIILNVFQHTIIRELHLVKFCIITIQCTVDFKH